MPVTKYNHLGNTLFMTLAELRVSQKSVADRLGLSYSFFNSLVNGRKRASPGLCDKLQKLFPHKLWHQLGAKDAGWKV